MKNSLKKNNNEVLVQKIFTYSQSSYQWLLNTPARALDKAYQSALKIKSLEADYLAAKQQTVNRSSSTILDCLQSDIDKYLVIIKINLAEFKVSRLILSSNNYNFWEKLIIVDDVLKKYRTDLIEPIIVPPVNTIEKSNFPINYPKIQDDLVNLKPVTEKTGALPRSLSRTFQKIKTELNNNNEEEILQNFRRSRRITKTAVKCILLLVIIPLLTQQLSKEFLFLPLVEQFRSQHQAVIFINNEMKEEAFQALQIFEEELKFNNLITVTSRLDPEVIEEQVMAKAKELAEEFHHKSSNAISNVFADLLGLFAFAGVALTNKPGIDAIKTFLDSIMYNLSDSAKAFVIIMFTDIFVGFHSPHGWEVILETVANHLGIEPNHSAIFLFIATFPVVLDTIFKYWIFRYLNRISPSAVATLKNMNE